MGKNRNMFVNKSKFTIKRLEWIFICEVYIYRKGRELKHKIILKFLTLKRLS